MAALKSLPVGSEISLNQIQGQLPTYDQKYLTEPLQILTIQPLCKKHMFQWEDHSRSVLTAAPETSCPG